MILETRDRIPRQAPGAWSLLLPLPMSLRLSLSLSLTIIKKNNKCREETTLKKIGRAMQSGLNRPTKLSKGGRDTMGMERGEKQTFITRHPRQEESAHDI